MSACDEAGGADRGPDQVLAPLTGDETRARFFDAAWPEHPCGASDALMLAALAKTAREHGGRGRVHPTPRAPSRS